VIISVRATSPAARWTSTVPRHVLESAAGAVADIGLRIAVEAFAWSAINSVPTTSALLARANASNAGHLLDVWHFYNTGSTTESITDLDVATVAAVQLNDGPRVHDYFREGAISTSAASSPQSSPLAMTARSASSRVIRSSESSTSPKQPPWRSTRR